MRTIIFSQIIAGVLLFTAAGATQEKGKMHQREQKQMMHMMQDSAMVHKMMAHIASHPELRMKMLHMMIEQAESDSSAMMQMGRTMMQNSAMRAMLTTLNERQTETPPQQGPELIVKFKKEAEMARVQAMESEIGLKQVKGIPALNMKVYQVISGQKLEDAIKACEKEPFVEYAEPNREYKTQK